MVFIIGLSPQMALADSRNGRSLVGRIVDGVVETVRRNPATVAGLAVGCTISRTGCVVGGLTGVVIDRAVIDRRPDSHAVTRDQSRDRQSRDRQGLQSERWNNRGIERGSVHDRRSPRIDRPSRTDPYRDRYEVRAYRRASDYRDRYRDGDLHTYRD